MFKGAIYVLVLFSFFLKGNDYKLPIKSSNRKKVSTLKLTSIGEFGLIRKSRPGISSHFHTGIDIMRPSNNYTDEPIYPICEGTVISKRDDGAYAQLIVEHTGNSKFWTVYEHVAGICVNVNSKVTPSAPMARFMNKAELDKYGWQFDHFHFEILKKEPLPLKKNKNNPQRLFASYSLTCYTKEALNNNFYNPIDYLNEQFNYKTINTR